MCYDFDLVTENALTRLIKWCCFWWNNFNSRILKDYYESVGNRVVSIDDFSGTFNSNPRATRFTTVNNLHYQILRALKYITFVRDKRFGGQRQLMIVDILHDSSLGYINQYGRVEINMIKEILILLFLVIEGQLQFYPSQIFS